MIDFKELLSGIISFLWENLVNFLKFEYKQILFGVTDIHNPGYSLLFIYLVFKLVQTIYNNIK